MNWIVDAQLPKRLARLLVERGHNAVHTLALPLQNKTPDSALLELAAIESRIVVTKDQDFVDSFWLAGRPDRLLLISTGNITNDELLELLRQNLDRIVSEFATARFIELDRAALIVHC